MSSSSSPDRSAGPDAFGDAYARAIALHRQGKVEEAERLYHTILEASPDHDGALQNLGVIEAQRGRLEEAFRHLRSVVARRPNAPGLLGNFANLLFELQRHEEAIAYYKRALALEPRQVPVRVNFAQALLAIGQPQAAMAEIRQALALAPRSAKAHSVLGSIHETLGQIDEACRAFETAIALAPRQIGTYRKLVTTRKCATADPFLAALESFTGDAAGLPVAEQIELHFALGKALADVGQHERAFRHLLEGNRLKRQNTVYDEPKALELLKRVSAAFTSEMLREKASLGHPSPVPIFILGMPRSGSTLVEQVLASHPQVFGAGEVNFFRRAVEGMKADDGAPLPFPPDASHLTAERLRGVADRYLTRLRALEPAALRITDKALSNFILAGMIHMALPNARIIHTRRDAIDTCLSGFSKLFTHGQPYTYDLGELGRYYRAYERLMAHWRDALPQGVMIDVQYEEVIADPETQVRRILAHCDLSWDDACLRFHETKRAVRTASAAQVRQPIYSSSVGRWRPYAAMLQPLFAALDKGEAP